MQTSPTLVPKSTCSVPHLQILRHFQPPDSDQMSFITLLANGIADIRVVYKKAKEVELKPRASKPWDMH